jgi:lipopolysaccharide transport system ATP-binding protein
MVCQMTDDIAIRVKGLGKKYIIGGHQEKYHTIRDAIVNSVKTPFRRLTTHNADPYVNEFWALKDVSYDVHKGEVIGIIGRNGAGKSTLLKILSRITLPSEGVVEVHGRIGSLLEVGTGFHPELTGLENIFLSGSILGMRKREIDQRLDEIVKFSEIEKFLETPVKRYSSGMYVRLAFAVAAHMDTEILLVDEVLAVGDIQFQKKCLGKMGDVAEKEGRTVLFVSHNMTAIKALCQRGILLDSGRIVYDGDVSRTIDNYLNKITPEIQKIPISSKIRDKKVSLRVKMLDINFFSENASIQEEIDSTKPLEICLKIQVFKKTRLACQIQIRDQYRTVILLSSELQQNKIFEFDEGTHVITCKCNPLFLSAGNYWVTCGLASGPHEWIDYVYDAYSFNVKSVDIYGNGFNLTQNISLYHVNHSWESY